uniref:uromodulin-like 1 isoform 1 precursor n=1 Tax=Danio rerio TaxID=7955 RepID=UPI003D9EAECB
MHWVVGAWVITLLFGFGRGHNTLIEGYEQTLSGYHLCNMNELVSMTRVVSYPSPYTQRRACGGWLPWNMCDVTVYKTAYQTEVYYISRQVKTCCHGYEQVGSYCALPLNRSAEFTSKPGLCPSARATGNHSDSGTVCNWDTDCPQWQKCCQTENNSSISRCLEPVPAANRTWCFNVTITVRTTYELLAIDKGLLNHTRLLHSVVTGALGNAEFSVHHVWSWSAGLFATSSSLLVCASKDFSIEDISAKLYQLGNIEEVTNVVVQVPSVIAEPFINTTTPSLITRSASGTNMFIGEPSSTVTSGPFWTSSHSYNPTSSPPSSTCDGVPEITRILSYDVTASSFHVEWITKTQTGVTFLLLLQKNGTAVHAWNDVTSFNWTFTDLNPAALYTVRVTPSACGIQGNPVEIKVRTDGQLLGATVRLTNVMYTEALSDPNSAAYKEFCDSFINETRLSLPPEILELLLSRKLILQITSISPGSIIVNFTIIFQPGSNLDIRNISNALMNSLQNSTKYVIDKNSIHISDLNECLLAEADCSRWAHCINTEGSYSCDCWSGYTDLNPRRPGRSCAASSNATASTVHPATNYTELSSAAITGNPSVSRTNVQSNLTTTTMSSASSTYANRLIQAISPATTLNITCHSVSCITVECSPWLIKVDIRRDYLKANNISETSLYLGNPECGPAGFDDSYLWLITAWDKCGTTPEHNNTHNSFSVTLFNNVSSSQTTTHLKVPVTCTYPSSVIISMGYAPAGYFEMINDPVNGWGSFEVLMRLLNGTHPLPENYTISQNENIFVEVGVNTTISQIKTVINKCWATSSSDSSQPSNYVFLDNGCPVPEKHTNVLQNGNGTVSLVAVQIFSVVNLDFVFLHCEIQICIAFQDSSCIPACDRLLSARSSKLFGLTRSVGPLNRLHTTTFQSNTSNTVQAVGFVLLGVGVFLLSLTVIAGLLYQKRKIGNYNFHVRPQPENFTYNVFNT